MSPRRMRYFTTVGVGLLIGVSFIVIIPEGVHTYYAAHKSDAHTHAAVQINSTRSGAGLDLDLGSLQRTPVAEPQQQDQQAQQQMGKDGSLRAHTQALAHAAHDDDEKEGHSHGKHGHGDDDDDEHEHDHSECVNLSRSSAAVGLALVAGFVVMFLVDRMGGEDGHAHGGGDDSPPQRGRTNSAHSHSPMHGHGGHGGHGREHAHSHAHREPAASAPPAIPSALTASANHQHVRSSSSEQDPLLHSPRSAHSASSSGSSSLSPLRDDKNSPARSSTGADDTSLSSADSAPLPPQQFDQTATVGILVHSAIDGLALGAISVSDNSALELVVFAAIILHKAPAAFGLTSFLLHQGRPPNEVRKHLLYFSLAAPVMSLSTFIAFAYYNRLAGSNSLSANSSDGQALLGLCLLFSAGTFLFTIAMHILPEIQPKGSGRHHSEWSMVGCLIAGILAPLAMSGHSHGH